MERRPHPRVRASGAGLTIPRWCGAPVYAVGAVPVATDLDGVAPDELAQWVRIIYLQGMGWRRGRPRSRRTFGELNRRADRVSKGSIGPSTGPRQLSQSPRLSQPRHGPTAPRGAPRLSPSSSRSPAPRAGFGDSRTPTISARAPRLEGSGPLRPDSRVAVPASALREASFAEPTPRTTRCEMTRATEREFLPPVVRARR